ncbi:MAG: DUF418 domain-containing protein [Nitriliruptoraceae bacterium]|nr:DUF418 domain-containing protein [Nitriliruptoraceae bacterium]
MAAIPDTSPVGTDRTRRRALRLRPWSAQPADTGPASPTGRVTGLDLARALAIVGMVAVHVGPLDDTSALGRVYALAHGRASLLFVLVAGVGIALLARARRGDLAAARRTLWWRAALLLPGGLLLQTLDHGVNVILQGYALLFVLAPLLLRASDRLVLALAGAAATLGPALFLWGRLQDPIRFQRDAIAWGDPLPAVLDGLVLSGPYPLITWTAPLLLGIWIGRRDLRAPRLQLSLVALGGVLAAGSLLAAHLAERLAAPTTAAAALLDATPHSQMPLWLVGGTGSAMLVLGASLWLAPRLTRATAPLVALGQLALTAYVAHLIALHLAPGLLRPDGLLPSMLIVVAGCAGMALAAWSWRRRFERGPLERGLQLPGPLRTSGQA